MAREFKAIRSSAMEMLRDQPVVELADFLRDVRRKPVRLRSATCPHRCQLRLLDTGRSRIRGGRGRSH